MNRRLVQETTFEMVRRLIELTHPHVEPEVKDYFFNGMYAIVEVELEAFCIQQDRMQQRMNPTSN